MPARLAGVLASRPGPRTDREDERRLIKAARAGDRAATETLLQRLSGTVFRFGQSFCRDPDEAQDLMQDVLRSLLLTLPGFRGESSLSTWAFTVARRACARRKRRMARMSPLEDGETALDPPDPGAGPHEEAERRELARAIRRAIAALPAAHREVVMLRDVEGLPASEVARVLGIGERAVKSRLHRARLALREALAPHAGGDWAEASNRPPARRLARGSSRRADPKPQREARAGTGGGERCPDTARLLSRYLEGELDAGVCDRLAAHVANCPSCGAACDSLRVALGACARWGAMPLPRPERERVRAAIRTAIEAWPRASG